MKTDNYSAQIIQINELIPIKNADKLLKTFVNGDIAIIGNNTKVGDLFVKFVPLSKINSEFLSKNNLFRDKNLNEDKTKTGFFDKNKVKPVMLRGERSECYLHPLESFNDFFGTKFDEKDIGLEFNQVNGKFVCEKWIVEENNKSINNKNQTIQKPKFDILIPNQFKFHVDTKQFKKNLHSFSPEDEVVITEKLHGTSGIVSNVLCYKKLSWKEKVLKKLGFNVIDTEYKVLYSSRKVIKNLTDKKGFYDFDLWSEIGEKLKNKIPKGFSVYYESVGSLPTGKFIQKEYDYQLLHKNVDYGVFVYRITYTNIDGKSYELNRTQIEDFCKQQDLDIVPLLYKGKLKDLLSFGDDIELLNWFQNSFNLEKDCKYCVNIVPAEGIVIQKENLYEYNAYKLKSFRFLQLEDKNIDNQISNIED